MLSVVITGALLFALFQYIPLQDLGHPVPARAGRNWWARSAVVLPLCPLIVAIQMYVATFAKSFKEAQSYLSFLMMVQMVPGMMATMNTDGDQDVDVLRAVGRPADAADRRARQQADPPGWCSWSWR